jgi:sarcosine oxidase
MATGLPGISLPLSLTRQPLFWFEVPPPLRAAAEGCPIFIWEWVPGRMCYGFPDLGDGLKAAIHHEGEPARPDGPRRPATVEEAGELQQVLAIRMPGLGSIRETAVCLYTNTPHGDFLIDRHPEDSRVLLASPCSGHGFKFAPVIGEVLADLVEERPPRFDLAPFRLARLHDAAPGA